MHQNNGFYISKPDLLSLLSELTFGAPKVWIDTQFHIEQGSHFNYCYGYAVASAFIPVAPDFFVPAEYRVLVTEFTSIDDPKKYEEVVEKKVQELISEATKQGAMIERGVITNKPRIAYK